MNEDFVSYELAVKLKEKGFRGFCVSGYNKEGRLIKNGFPVEDGFVEYDMFLQCHNLRPNAFDAPIITQVLKWLRKEKCLHIEIISTAYGYVYVVSRTPDLGGTDVKCSDYSGPNDGGAWDEWEDCALAAIGYVLDNLI